MTITIDLQPEIERGLLVLAQAKGVSLTDFAQEVLAREASAIPSAEAQVASEPNLYELFAPVRGLITDEEIDQYFSRTPSSSRAVDFE